MEFRLLGPFEATHEGKPVRIGRRQERRLLTALLLAPPRRPVPADRLIAGLWPEHPPTAARGVVHTYIGRLRRALEPYGISIDHLGDGYRLSDPDAYDLDVRTFRQLAATRTADPAEQADLYRRALDLWRGDLDDVALTETRTDTAERYARLLVDSGRDEQAAALATITDPTRERLCASVMTALHRCGRRAEALHLYARAEQALADLGTTPGPALTTLRDKIDRADPDLVRPPAPVYAVRVRDQWLPWLTGGHPALDFCNTYAGWGGEPGSGYDWLRGYATLAVWTGHVGLTDDWIVNRLLTAARKDPAAAAKVLTEARDLRRHLYASCTDPDDTVAFKAVATVADAAARMSTFVRGADGLGQWRITTAAGLRLPVYAAARSAADLLGDAQRHTVRACPGVECGWLFLSEQGRRRWCSLGGCGRLCS